MDRAGVNEVLLAVDPAKIDAIWPYVSQFLQAAFQTGLGDDDLPTLKANLDAGRAVLWVVWDGEELIAAATTELVKVPTKKLCIITACGGRELKRWRKFIADLEQYAKREQCDAMRVMGRHGWRMIFPDYREPWICLEKELR